MEKWESGASKPQGAALKLLCVIKKHGLEILTYARKMTSNFLIPGWKLGGLSEEHYAAGIDKETFYQGSQSARLLSVGETVPGSAGIYQHISASNYQNCKIRFSAFVKTLEVEDRCGLYVSASTRGFPTVLDDMSNRPIKGTTDWQQYSAVINVSKNSSEIQFGVFLAGSGSIWIDSATLEIAGDEVASTAVSRGSLGDEPLSDEDSELNARYEALPTSPVNMNFEER